MIDISINIVDTQLHVEYLCMYALILLGRLSSSDRFLQISLYFAWSHLGQRQEDSQSGGWRYDLRAPQEA